MDENHRGALVIVIFILKMHIHRLAFAATMLEMRTSFPLLRSWSVSPVGAVAIMVQNGDEIYDEVRCVDA
jgi:hypothetical protein